jgi:DNA polymerase-3 subunit delta'
MTLVAAELPAVPSALQAAEPLAGVIGNAAAAGFLRAVLLSGRTSHAYILTGPAQVGKRTLARAFAAGLVCQNAPPAVAVPPAESGAAVSTMLPRTLNLDVPAAPPVRDLPCGRCRACALVARDSHPDVRFVGLEPGRRSILIEQVRQLEHDAGLRPYEGTRKAFIVVDAELLTDAAANALLKTLEEPPDDTVLVLTAADASQVLPTIASRCQEVPLRPVPTEEIAQGLVARGVEPARAQFLARLAGGRPGWALAAVQDETRLATRQALVEQLEQLLAAPPVARLPAAAGFGDLEAVRLALDTWLGWWRDALLVRQGCDDLVASVDRLAQLRRLAPPAAACVRAIQRMRQAREQVDANANLRLAVEALLLDLPPAGA